MTSGLLPISEVKKRIEEEFPIYWAKIFGIVTDGFVLPNGIRVSKDNKDQEKNLKKIVKSWEGQIEKYSQEAKAILDLQLFDESNEECYDTEEFKQHVFAKGLWTVRSALTTPDPELDQYKSRFHATTAKDIYVAVGNILSGAMNYAGSVCQHLSYNRISTPEQLKLEFLNEDGLLLTGVIGLGIRSEILHRMYPGAFAMMTRRNGWGMFFLSQELDEFVDRKSVV